MTASLTAADLRDLSPGALAEPHSLFEAWRATGPVVEVPELAGWVVTDFTLATQVMRDPDAWSSDRFDGPVPPELETWLAELAAEEPALRELLSVPLQTLVALDPPDHGRLRRVLVPFFSAAKIKRLEPLVDGQVEALIGALPLGEPFDFVARYADVLPFRVVALLFGLAEAEWPEFRRLAAEANSDNPHLETKETLRERLHAELALMRYFRERIETPDGVDPEGLIAGLRAAVDAGDISIREATGLCREVLVAGADSTGNHLAMALLALTRDPALLARLQAHAPDIEPFVEEMLRLEPPFKGFWRRATRDTQIGGAAIPRDGLVLLAYQALNRDPAAFEDPHAIDLDRPAPKRHLTFGHGIHFCLGAPLARLQSNATFRAIVALAREIELAVPGDALRRRASMQIGGVESLPVRLRPAAG